MPSKSLIVFLSRFRRDKKLNITEKNMSFVECSEYITFPAINLDSLSNQQQNHIITVKYKLQAISLHIGISPNSGHYISFCKVNLNNDQWIYFNDNHSSIHTFNEIKSILSSNRTMTPVLLFYKYVSQISIEDDNNNQDYNTTNNNNIKKRKNYNNSNSNENDIFSSSKKKRSRSFENIDHNQNLDNEKNLKLKTSPSLIEDYERAILDVPEYVCVCCGLIFFKSSVSRFNPHSFIDHSKNKNLFEIVFYLKKKFSVRSSKDSNFFWLCKTCNFSIASQKVPKLALANGWDFVRADERVKNLNPLELKLCSPRIHFLSILTKYDNQKSLRGNIINIPVNVNEMITTSIPRELSNTGMIYISLFRKLGYQNYYMRDFIRPRMVLDAVKYLCEQSLYKKNNIKLSVDWLINKGLNEG